MVLTDFKKDSPRKPTTLGDVDTIRVQGVQDYSEELRSEVYRVAVLVAAFGGPPLGLGCACTGGS